MKELPNLQEIADLFSNTTKLEDLLPKIILTLAKLTNSEIGSIYIPNIDNNSLELKYIVIKEGNNFKVIKKENYFVPFDKGIVGWVYRNRSIYITNDTELDKFYIPLKSITKSNIAFPIISTEGEILGIINLEDPSENKYTETEIEKINFIIPIISTILSYHRKLEKENYEKKLFSLLYSINKIFHSIEDLDIIFEKLVNFLTDHLNIKRGMIFLIDDEDNTLKITKSIGLTEEEKSRGIYKLGEGIVGTVALNKEKISTKNIWEDNRFMNKTKAKRPKNKKISFFANPIIFNEKLLGVITSEKEFENDKDFEITEKIMEEISNLIGLSVYKYIKLMKEKEELENENKLLKEQLSDKYKIEGIIGKSDKILKILDIIESVANTNSTVLIQGESGTGKELIARAIHFRSNRKDKPFIAINCAAIPETLLESELFGYKKGAFTGAISDKKGKILLANGGTLFLDEIGDMPLSLQAKLLRVIQNREVEPIGGTPIKVDIRIISATNKNLEELVSQEKFRLDLYYRLNVVKIELPPLRERIQDIPLFVDFFVKKFSQEHNKKIEYVDSKVVDYLMMYDWPGNIRELENVIEQMVVLSKNNKITEDLLPKHLKISPKIKTNYEEEIRELITEYISKLNLSTEKNLYDKIVQPVVKTLINQLMTKLNNKKTKVSEVLGINRNTLASYLKKNKNA